MGAGPRHPFRCAAPAKRARAHSSPPVSATYASRSSSSADGRRVDAELDEPAVAERVGVDERRVVDDGVVDGDDVAGERRVELADRLRRLDLAADLARRDAGAGAGQLDEDDVAELVGRVVGDADGRDVAVEGDPLVLGGVLEGVEIGHLFLR